MAGPLGATAQSFFVPVLSVPPLSGVPLSEVPVPTLEGKANLKVPAGTQSGQMFKLRGKGLPDLRSVAPNGLTYSICLFGVFPSGN